MATKTLAASFLFSSLLTYANAQGGELSQIISESVVQFSECSTFIQTCPPTRTSCASYLCQQCTSIGDKALNSCCLEANPAACMQTWLATETSSPNAGASLAASSAGLDTNAQGCSTIENIYSSCETATPGFTDLADADAASCLCYSGNTWVPNVLDNAAASCATYFAENDDATDASTLAALTNFCSSIGNVLTMASTSASATPAGSSSGSAAATSTSAGSASAAASASSGASASATSDSGSSSSSAAVGGSQMLPILLCVIVAPMTLVLSIVL